MKWNWTTLKFLVGSTLAIPLLPLMYFHGKRVMRNIPDLPPAEGPAGVVGEGGGRAFKLLTLGESTVAGVGSSTHQTAFTGTLAALLAKRLGRPVDWTVIAESGYTTRRMVEEILPRIPAMEVDLIVVGTGGNDAFKMSRPDQFRKQVGRLVDGLRARYPEVPIAFMNVPPIKEFPSFTATLKATIGGLVELHGEELERAVRHRKNVYYNPEKIRLLTWQDRYQVFGAPDKFFSDGVHPSTLTYQFWARDFEEWLFRAEALDSN